MGSFTKWLGAGLGFTLGDQWAELVLQYGSFVDGFSRKDLKGTSNQNQQRRGCMQYTIWRF